MTFLAPLFLAAAGAAALVLTALHLFARHRPPRRMLPTARFVPDREARAASFAPKLTDGALLAVRVAALLLVGTALARPVRTASPREAGRVVLADRSRAVADVAEVRDSVLALLDPGDVLVAFADSSRIVTEAARDTAESLELLDRRGSLSGALIAATRAARNVDDAATVELVLVSPLVRESLDAATEEIRATWPGPIRVVPVRARSMDGDASGAERRLAVRGGADDPVVLAASFGSVRARAPVRIVRGAVTTADSAWARDSAGVLVHWPAAAAVSDDSAGREARPHAVAAGGAVLIAELVRRDDRQRVPGGDPFAWWLDGVPAANETVLGEGCIREVAIGLPRTGDLALRPELRRFLAELAAPCGGVRDWTAIDQSTLDRLRGEGQAPDRMQLHRLEALPAPLVPWLLAAALACLLLELAMRGRRGSRP